MTWPRYLAGFHQHRPGITEAVLTRSTSRGHTPYQWLLEALPPHGLVLDLACGSAPLWPSLAIRSYVGIDTSPAELACAREHGAGPVLLADAAALPLATGSAAAVVCSMALMLLTPLEQVLAEVRRVLAPGGVLVATVPTNGPLAAGDLPLVLALLAALGHPLHYPNDQALSSIRPLMSRAGLSVVSDDRRRFGFRLDQPTDADLFAASLYLPGDTGGERRRVRAALRAAMAVRTEVPVPIRRMVARAK